MNEFCPDCGGILEVEDGLLYCPADDTYHGEAEEEDYY